MSSGAETKQLRLPGPDIHFYQDSSIGRAAAVMERSFQAADPNRHSEIPQSDFVIALDEMAPKMRRLVWLVALNGSVANAIANGINVGLEATVGFRPQELGSGDVKLLRVFRHWDQFFLCEALKRLMQVLDEAIRLFDLIVIFDRGSKEWCTQLDKCADHWRECCLYASDLIRAISRTDAWTRMSSPARVDVHLLRLLNEVACGGHPLVERRGSVSIPNWLEGRKSVRRDTRLPALLKSSGGVQRVEIAQLSADGVGLIGVDGLIRSVPILLAVGEVEFLCTVAWSRLGRAGVRFRNTRT